MFSDVVHKWSSSAVMNKMGNCETNCETETSSTEVQVQHNQRLLPALLPALPETVVRAVRARSSHQLQEGKRQEKVGIPETGPRSLLHLPKDPPKDTTSRRTCRTTSSLVYNMFCRLKILSSGLSSEEDGRRDPL